MKKRLILSAVIVAVLGLTMIHPSSKPIKKESAIVTTQDKPTEQASETPTEQSVVPQTVNDTQVSEQAPQTASEAPTAQSTVPSIDELKVQYGWNAMAGSPIEMMMSREPQYFTEQYRVQAFKYMYDAGFNYAQKNGSVSPNTICYWWVQTYRQSGDFISTGKTMGVDWNNYING